MQDTGQGIEVMPRFKLTIEYDGSNFVGWQKQSNGPSVQAAIEDALFTLSSESVEVIGAGRTDAGVHARAMIAHFDLSTDRFDGETVGKALNYHLASNTISILGATLVTYDFHARFSATRRHYLYRILNRPAPPALERGRVWPVKKPLDADAMHEAAQILIGHHNFTSFRATQCQAASPEKTLERLDVSRVGEEIHIAAVARSFLHHQVRNMTGSLKLVGEGKWGPSDIERALGAQARTAAGPTAPAAGLYLVRVDYDF